MMRLSISNIAWQAEDDAVVYGWMKDYGFTGLEIAPTRVFPEKPYEDLNRAAAWAGELGFAVPSMQSIWYGRREKLFGSCEERGELLDYTRKAIDFAAAIHCGNLVFGCPSNRVLPEDADPEIGIAFFREIGNYAASKGTVIGMEANPPIYNTNYINDTASALELIEAVDSPGFQLNLDVGTMVQNGEAVSVLEGKVDRINHVHISEPGLKMIQERELHSRLAQLLRDGYDGFVSIEMGRSEDLKNVENAMRYVKGIFG